MARSTQDKQDADISLRDSREAYRNATKQVVVAFQTLEAAWAMMEEYRTMFDTGDTEQADQLALDDQALENQLNRHLRNGTIPGYDQNLETVFAWFLDVWLVNMSGKPNSTRDAVLDQMKEANIAPYTFPAAPATFGSKNK